MCNKHIGFAKAGVKFPCGELFVKLIRKKPFSFTNFCILAKENGFCSVRFLTESFVFLSPAFAKPFPVSRNFMKKKTLKYIIPIFLLFILFIINKYSKPKVFIKKEIIENTIPFKIDVFNGNNNFGDSIVLYLPYKFNIQNNRFRKIGIDEMSFKQIKYINGKIYNLCFNQEGKPIIDYKSNRENKFLLDKYLQEIQIIEYLKLKNIGILFPFSNENLYYYKSYKLHKKVLGKELSRKEYVNLNRDFIEKQKQELYTKPSFKVSQKLIDSLYDADKTQELFFKFRKNQKYGWYIIKYHLNNDEQYFTDYYEIIKKIVNRKDKEALYQLMNKHSYDE